MIALIIIPLVFADPTSRKVLIPDESNPSKRFAGEDNEGFYSALGGANVWRHENPGYFWAGGWCRIVVPHDLPLFCVAQRIGSDELVGIYIEHFSAPTDADNHFVETPLLTAKENTLR
jgi:hypothetical protein